MTDIMMQGTKNRTPIELEEAIDDLGASITMYTTKESIVIQANCFHPSLMILTIWLRKFSLNPGGMKRNLKELRKKQSKLLTGIMLILRLLQQMFLTKSFMVQKIS